jgi:hypothetical protein
MILRATIGRRCVCRFFSFLELFPLMFTKYLFSLFSLFKGTVTIEYEMKIFSHPLAHVSIWKLLRFIGHFCLWTCTLILVLGGWVSLKHLVALFRPHFRSLFISLDSFPSPCCNIVFCLCLFCDFVQMYGIVECMVVFLDMRLNGMSESPFLF